MSLVGCMEDPHWDSGWMESLGSFHRYHGQIDPQIWILWLVTISWKLGIRWDKLIDWNNIVVFSSEFQPVFSHSRRFRQEQPKESQFPPAGPRSPGAFGEVMEPWENQSENHRKIHPNGWFPWEIHLSLGYFFARLINGRFIAGKIMRIDRKQVVNNGPKRHTNWRLLPGICLDEVSLWSGCSSKQFFARCHHRSDA